MPNLRLFKTRNKAFGLIEVLVAMAISAILMVGSIEVAANSLRTVKQNEYKDFASGILLKSLEITRSPIPLNLTGKVGASAADKPFKLELVYDAVQGTNLVDLVAAVEVLPISDCDSSSEYFVNTNVAIDATTKDNLSQFLICNQIIVRQPPALQVPPSGNVAIRNFAVDSIVVYKIVGKTFTDTLTSYRTEYEAIP